MIPGGNLLNLAMSVIAKQQLSYIAYTGRSVAVNGDYVDTFAAPVTVYGSIQPVKRSLYDQMGLDFQKNFHNIFISLDVKDVRRATASDRFSYKGITFQVLSNEPWFNMDGWDQTLCVEVPSS